MPASGLNKLRWVPRFLRSETVPWKAWGLRVLALVLAFLLFLISRQPISEVRLVGVPVEYVGIPSGLELTGDILQTVSVRVSGPRDIVRGLPPTQLAVEANLSNKIAGDRTIQLRPGNVNLPDNVKVLRIEPASLRLRLEPTLHKRVKVEPQLTLPEEGLDVYAASAEPEVVEIEGPASLVAPVNAVKTESLSLRGRRENFSVPIEIELPQAGLRLTDNNTNVRLKVEMGPRRATRLLKAVPLKLVHAPAGMTLDVKTIEVVVSGALADLQQLQETEIVAEIDGGKLPPNAATAVPVVRLPAALAARVSVKSVNPVEVNVKR